jgi:hypothetical protein
VVSSLCFVLGALYFELLVIKGALAQAAISITRPSTKHKVQSTNRNGLLTTDN